MKRALILLIIITTLLISGFSQNGVLAILHTNDTHSQIEPFEYKEMGLVGGVLRRNELITETRAQYPQLLLLDAGDFSQGTPYFNFFKGYVEIELMNRMGYDVTTLGNHEFDNGVKALAKRLKNAKFDVVCANYTFHNRLLKREVKPYIILERAGFKIGIFGLTTDLTGLTSPETLKLITYHDAIETAKNLVPILRNELKCNLIICLSHLGFDSENPENPVCDTTLAKEVGGINIIIGGHTHTFLSEPYIVNGVRILQVANKGKHIGEIIVDKNKYND